MDTRFFTLEGWVSWSLLAAAGEVYLISQSITFYPASSGRVNSGRVALELETVSGPESSGF